MGPATLIISRNLLCARAATVKRSRYISRAITIKENARARNIPYVATGLNNYSPALFSRALFSTCESRSSCCNCSLAIPGGRRPLGSIMHETTASSRHICGRLPPEMQGFRAEPPVPALRLPSRRKRLAPSIPTGAHYLEVMSLHFLLLEARGRAGIMSQRSIADGRQSLGP